MPAYLRPATSYRTEIEISKSRFIASVVPAQSVERARHLLADIHHEMPDANHHVYAFVIGHGATVTEGLSDAGEPSGTAGLPVMTVLRGSELGDILVVVTRYFGGVLLGTGGLVRAYTDAAKAGIAGVSVERKVERRQYMVTVPYSAFERVQRLIHVYEAMIIEQDFSSDVSVILDVPIEHASELELRITSLCSGKAVFAVI